MTALCAHSYCDAQSRRPLLFGYIDYVSTDSGLQEIHYRKMVCKGVMIQNSLIKENTVAPLVEISAPLQKNKVKFLTVHGNVMYDFTYRSRMDTPYVQEDLKQHSERVWLDIMVREKYPIKLGFTARQSNSPLFRNFLDANFQFDKQVFQRNQRALLEKKITEAFPLKKILKDAENEIEKARALLKLAEKKIENNNSSQQQIEEKERAYGNRSTTVDNSEKQTQSLKKINDSLLKKRDAISGRVKNKYEREKMQVDSIKESIKTLSARADSMRMKLTKDIFKLKQQISKARQGRELADLAKEYGVKNEGEDKQTNMEKFLSGVNTLSIGRSMIDYTELTAQHIMISGINVEINPSYYAAFAAGKINYRFRDFLNRKLKNNNQYLLLGRFGLGDRNKKALIFTLFQGRKSQSEYAISDTISNDIGITGYSVEAIWRRDAFSFLSAEFAKSTKPISGAGTHAENTSVLLNFSDDANMGLNIKGETKFPKTSTRLGGYFRRTGQQFQSFSLFSYNSNQTAWQARVEQPFFKNRMSITGMLRQNDFSNVFTEKTYKASTVFKSVLLNIRIPRYPVISAGYYPGTQLYIIDKDRIRENAYYIINGSVVYNYKYKGIGMTSSFMYNRYINQSSDSGFLLYKGVNYYASQNIFLTRLQLQGSYAYNSQPFLRYHSIEGSGELSIRKWLRAGAGIKYNTVQHGTDYLGKRMQVSIEAKWFGGLQFQYEKSYLPTVTNTLFPIEMGRVIWFKNF